MIHSKKLKVAVVSTLIVFAFIYVCGTTLIMKPGTYQTVGGAVVSYPIAGIYWKFAEKPVLLVDLSKK